MTWFTFFLLLHIFFAIAVFGPTFSFPLIGSFAKKDPRNAHLVTEIMHAVETRIVLPGGAIMPFLGLALIYLGHFQLWKSTWLLIAIPLYIVAYFFAGLVQLPNSTKMLRLLEQMHVPAPAAVAEAGMVPVAGASGPPPEIAAQAKKLQLGGMFLTLLLVAIIVLMVWRPGSCFTGSVC